jgi:hypothetical protein
MYIGKCGLPFNGETWDDFCQKCFAIKYDPEGYQKMPAYNGGDLGIEGFTRTGKVFQSYCPNVPINPDKLYEHQRDKITTDTNKLILNEKKLKSCLNGVEIEKWIFYTPDLLNKELVEHAAKKSNELLKKKCSIISRNFHILIHDFDYLDPYVEQILGQMPRRLGFRPETLDGEALANWADSEIELVMNSNRKNKSRLFNVQLTESQIVDRVNKMTERNIRNFLNGESITRNWLLKFPEILANFLSLKGAIEHLAEDICATSSNPAEAYESIQKMVESKLANAFPNLDETTRTHLNSHLMADWILRCPIEFS